MTIREYFESTPTLDVTAAHIGISKWDWISVSEENEDEAKKLMKENRFDVLPIIQNGKVEKFFSTRNWNDYSSLNCTKIADNEIIYYRTSIHDLLKLFEEKDCHFFFLSDNRDILGLVSKVNLSSQLVYDFFYHSISDLEKNLADFFSKKITHSDLVTDLRDSPNEHLNEVYKKFEKRQEVGIDNTIYQQFYLKTYGYLIKRFGSNLEGKERELLEFRKKFGPSSIYTKIRNTIMHPSKGLPNDEVSIRHLNEFLDDIDRINLLVK